MARRRGPRWLRSARRRPAAFVSLLLLSCLAVVVSVLTPLLLRSVQEVGLEEGVASAAAADRSVVGVAQATGAVDVPSAEDAVSQISASLSSRLFGPVTSASESFRAVAWIAKTKGAVQQTGYFSIAPAGCAGMTILQGTCPTDATEALVPESAERTLHIPVKTTVRFDPVTSGPDVTVVGVYDDARGAGRVLSQVSALVGPPITTSARDLVVGSAHLDDLPGYSLIVYSSRTVRDPVRLTDVAGIRHDIAAANESTVNSVAAGDTAAVVKTGLTPLLARLEGQQSAASILTTAVALEALALAWFSLGYVIQRISRVRAVEWGIARTRGIRRRSWLATVFVEPVIAIVLGTVAGVLLGVALAAALARTALGPAAAVDPAQPIVVAAVVLAAGGSLVALVAASLRSARLPLPSLLRETTEPRTLSRVALVAQSGAVLLAAAVVWSSLTQTAVSGPQLALLAPMLIALLTGIVALRITVVVVRRGTARPPRSLTGMVVGRGLARAPSTLYGAMMVAVGIALAAYVLQLALVAGALEDRRADAAVGAATVLHVTPRAGVDLLTAVRRADPTGRVAMAAVEASGGSAAGTERIIAVDTSRIAAVSSWLPEWRGLATPTLEKRLDPAVGAPLELRGTSVRLQVASVAKGRQEPLPDPTPVLQMVLSTPAGWQTVSLDRIRTGTMSAAIPCPTGCRLVSFQIYNAGAVTPYPFGVSFTLSSLSTDAQRASNFTPWLSSAAKWRQKFSDSADPTKPNTARIRVVPTGLQMSVDDSDGGLVTSVEPAIGSPTLPALLATGTPTQPYQGIRHAVIGSTLDRSPLVLQIVADAPTLPRLLDQGALVDLSQLERITDTSHAPASDEVWLAPGSHPTVVAALAGQGVRITGTDSLAATQADYRTDAPVRAADLTLGTAIAAVLLTLLAVVASRIVGLRARRRDWDSLRYAGLPAARLRRLSVIEFVVPNVVGALLGVAAGVLAFVLTATNLPLLTGVPAPPPDLTPPVVALLLLAGFGSVAIALIGLALGRYEVRSAT